MVIHQYWHLLYSRRWQRKLDFRSSIVNGKCKYCNQVQGQDEDEVHSTHSFFSCSCLALSCSSRSLLLFCSSICSATCLSLSFSASSISLRFSCRPLAVFYRKTVRQNKDHCCSTYGRISIITEHHVLKSFKQQTLILET